MFRLTRASKYEKEKLLVVAREAPLSSPHLLTLTDGPLGTPPRGFVHDLSRSHIGQGQRAFAAAREAFQRWEQFDLGWVRIAVPVPKVVPGELAAVEAHTACLWSISLNRIVEVVGQPNSFRLYVHHHCLSRRGGAGALCHRVRYRERVGALSDRSHIPSEAYSGPHRLSISRERCSFDSQEIHTHG